MRRSNSACDFSAVFWSNMISNGQLLAGGRSARASLTVPHRARQLQTAQPVVASAVDYGAHGRMDAPPLAWRSINRSAGGVPRNERAATPPVSQWGSAV